MLVYLWKLNPTHFYHLFGKKKGKHSSSLTDDDFYWHFKGLVEFKSSVNTGFTYDIANTEPVYEELDKEITQDEISRAIKKLKCYKSSREDCILNELLTSCEELFLPFICVLFNEILLSGIYPEAWTTSWIIPLHKKGNIDDMNNCGSISIVSCFGKLFSSVLNSRL